MREERERESVCVCVCECVWLGNVPVRNGSLFIRHDYDKYRNENQAATQTDRDRHSDKQMTDRQNKQSDK